MRQTESASQVETLLDMRYAAGLHSYLDSRPTYWSAANIYGAEMSSGFQDENRSCCDNRSENSFKNVGRPSSIGKTEQWALQPNLREAPHVDEIVCCLHVYLPRNPPNEECEMKLPRNPACAATTLHPNWHRMCGSTQTSVLQE